MRRRRLRVVEPRDAVDVADRVRGGAAGPTNDGQRRARPRRRRPGPISSTSAGRGERVGDVVRQRPAHRADVGQRSAADRVRTASAIGRRAPVVAAVEPERDVPRRRRVEMPRSRPDRRRTRSPCRRRAGWRRSGALAASYVAIDVCQFRWSGARLSHAAASARKRRRPRQPEARALDDERVDVAGRSRRRAACPCCRRRSCGRPPARSISTVSSVVVVLPSVPVMASIGRGPPASVLLPAVGELDLATPGRRRGGGRPSMTGVRLGHARRRRHEIARADQPVELRLASASASSSTPRSSASALGVRRSGRRRRRPRRRRARRSARTVDAPATARPYTSARHGAARRDVR